MAADRVLDFRGCLAADGKVASGGNPEDRLRGQETADGYIPAIARAFEPDLIGKRMATNGEGKIEDQQLQ